MKIKYKKLKSGVYIEIDLQNQFNVNLFQCMLKELSFKIEEEFSAITYQERMARASMIMSLHTILQKVRVATKIKLNVYEAVAWYYAVLDRTIQGIEASTLALFETLTNTIDQKIIKQPLLL